MEQTESDWQSLDDLIMEKIFESLSIRDRFNASLVCRRWSACFELPKVWQTVVIHEQWLTKLVNDNLNDGQSSRVLNYERVTKCLQNIGQHIRNVYIRQFQQFIGLYQFFVLLGWYSDKKTRTMNSFSPANIQRFTFNFPCDQALEVQQNGIKLFGIGGELMGSFKKLLPKMQKLRELELNDLVLEKYEANRLMDQMSLCLHSLKQVTLTNLTINHCPLQQITMLSNLKVLKLSPQNIDDSMLRLIAESKLKDLHIVQNENTPKTVTPCTAKAWIHFKQCASRDLQVHLEGTAKKTTEICDLLIQPEAPIYSITCTNVKKGIVSKIIENYSDCLRVYSDESSANCDLEMIEMVSKLSNLSALEIRRPITTGTLLMLISVDGNLQKISVRRSKVIIKYEEWLTELCENNEVDSEWIRTNCESLDRVEYAISSHFSRPWRFSS